MKAVLRPLIFCLFFSSSFAHAENFSKEDQIYWSGGAVLGIGIVLLCLIKYSQYQTKKKKLNATRKIIKHINTYQPSPNNNALYEKITNCLTETADPNLAIILDSDLKTTAAQLAIRKNIPPYAIALLIRSNAHYEPQDIHNALEQNNQDIANLLNIWKHIKPRPKEEQLLNIPLEQEEGYYREDNDIYFLKWDEATLLQRLERAKNAHRKTSIPANRINRHKKSTSGVSIDSLLKRRASLSKNGSSNNHEPSSNLAIVIPSPHAIHEKSSSRINFNSLEKFASSSYASTSGSTSSSDSHESTASTEID